MRSQVRIYTVCVNAIINDLNTPDTPKTIKGHRIYKDVSDKYATGVPKIKKIRGSENISVGSWNVRTLRPAEKLQQLTH